MTGEERQVKTVENKLVSVDQVTQLVRQLSFGEMNLKMALLHGKYYHSEDDDVFYNETLSIEHNQTVLV